MSMAQKPIIGSIIERKPTSSFSNPKPSSLSRTGFPAVQHRSKSTFSRNREEVRNFGRSRAKDVPPVLPSTHISPPLSQSQPDDWREQISKENEDRLAAMTEEEREEERAQILQRFGANVGEILKRARLARSKQQDKVSQEKENLIEVPIPVTNEERKPIERARSPPPSSLASPGGTRPSSRTDRRLRFAELEPEDVHVYESAPPSPKRKPLALPPPDPTTGQTASLGQWKGKMAPQRVEKKLQPESMPTPNASDGPEEGSAEYIRRHFFPLAPKDDPNLAWMDVDSIPASDSSASSLRFDLRGNPIPPSISLSLPTHLGLHHHAEGSHAGYTLDDIFLLSRSTVPAQRATMLGILARIENRLAKMKKGIVDGMDELVGQEDDLRKRILAAGVEAMTSRGNVGTHAIEVVWECIVGWKSDMINPEGAELDASSDSAVSTLPLDYFLPQVTTMLDQGGVPPESATQLLSILHRLAQYNTTIATSIVSTQKMLPTIVQTFLLTPIQQHDSSPLPDPLALQLLNTLALSSRSNAHEIEKLVDPLLRFVTFSSFDSPYPPTLATILLTNTLELYRTLASYGLYTHIAGTAVEQLAHIEQYVISEACTSNALTVAWAKLVEAWIVCATDPHQTTPPHDIKWSQVAGWSWNVGISELQDRLGTQERDWVMWKASWQAQAAWLEGAQINGIKGGEVERLEFIESMKTGFESGREREVLEAALGLLHKELVGYQNGDSEQLDKIADHVGVLTSLIRMWLACVPRHWEGVPPTPPFSLPYNQLSELARTLLNHPLWSLLTSSSTPILYIHCREISQFLSYYLRLSKRLPGVSQSLWLAQAFSVVLRLTPGDEDQAITTVREIVTLLNQQWATSQGIEISPLIWERGGLAILQPFLFNTMRPLEDSYIGPLSMTPQSIKLSTTQRLPAASFLQRLGLPLRRDWTMSPLDHLLRSADSIVFKALPESWDSSEVEVTRAALLLTKVAQEALLNFSITSFILTREEAEFGCMKVFMLEHGQTQNDSAEEVFRDVLVGRLMEDVLRPYTAESPDAHIVPSSSETDLEKVAARFLGPSVPFFQFYTDFVSLYDAVSFSHPLFARLLIPPTSMRYPLDYRKHLWCDFNHVVKTIRVLPEQVLSADIREYLYPLETDPQIIASYLSSLLKDNLHDFMRLVALHHIASNIWSDLHDKVDNEDRASTLFKAVVGQASINVLRDVVCYRQAISGPVILPPKCFEAIDDVRILRMNSILRWGGQTVANRLQGLLNT